MARYEEFPSEQRIPKITKVRIIKNLVLICLSFFLLFTAYDGLSMLQSTMNQESGIGVISQAVGYISFCISALLLPNYVIEKLGCKYSLFVSILLYVPFIAANFYPKWYIMIPTGIFSGIGASLLWGSQCTYFNESAYRFAKLVVEGSGEDEQASEVSANHTRVDIISERENPHEMKGVIPLQENPSEKDKLQTKTSEHNVVKFRCKNTSCENIHEFVVAEIAKNCIQYLKNTSETSNTQQVSEEINSNDLSLDEISTSRGTSSVKTENKPEGITKNALHKVVETSKDEEGIKTEKLQYIELTNISKPHEDSVHPKRNKDHMPIFQRGNTLESVTGLFFGCHGASYYSAQICSNVISYYILKGDDLEITKFLTGCSCGAQFCNDNPLCISDDTEYVSKKIRYLLTGISVILAVISALLMLLFLDPLNKVKSNDEVEESEKLSPNLLLATIHQTKKKEQLCLIPITFYEGMLQGFYTGDFTKSYVGCAWGASNVGLVSVFYGSASVFLSSISGCLVKYAGRKLLFLSGQVISLLMTVFLLLWKPEAESPFKFYIAAIFFGIITGIFWSQLLAFYGLLFKKDEEAAFASYYLWSSLGWTTSFLLSDHLCTYIKIYMLLAVSILGTTGYLFTEKSYKLRKQR